MFLCSYSYIHAHIHIIILIFKFILIYSYSYIHTPKCMLILMVMYSYSYVHSTTCWYIHIFEYSCIHIFVCSYIHIRIHTITIITSIPATIFVTASTSTIMTIDAFFIGTTITAAAATAIVRRTPLSALALVPARQSANVLHCGHTWLLFRECLRAGSSFAGSSWLGFSCSCSCQCGDVLHLLVEEGSPRRVERLDYKF